ELLLRRFFDKPGYVHPLDQIADMTGPGRIRYPVLTAGSDPRPEDLQRKAAASHGDDAKRLGEFLDSALNQATEIEASPCRREWGNVSTDENRHHRNVHLRGHEVQRD